VTTLFLVRHAVHGLLAGILVGRMPNIPLTEDGRDQARRLAVRLSRESIAAVQSSPQQRARETATPIARALGVPLEVEPAVDEIDMGEWTGRSFEDLRTDPRWELWNRARSCVRVPGGESMIDVEQRVARHLERVRCERPDANVVIVSHAEVIRAALLRSLGLSLDAFAQIEISPASISTLAIGHWGSKILNLNEVPAE
jgi:broad specificity phosphatase PhoE